MLQHVISPEPCEGAWFRELDFRLGESRRLTEGCEGVEDQE